MTTFVAGVGAAYNKTATGDVVTSRNVALLGFYVNSTASGTVVLRKGGSGGTVISGTITPAVGFHSFPATCEGGLHATIANTLDVTFFVAEP